jgi:hypothetical protein
MRYKWKGSPLWFRGALIGSFISLFFILIQGVVPNLILNVLRVIYFPAYFASLLCKGGLECLAVLIFLSGIVMVIEGFFVGLIVGLIITKRNTSGVQEVIITSSPNKNNKWIAIAVIVLIALILLSIPAGIVSAMLSASYTSTNERRNVNVAINEICTDTSKGDIDAYNTCVEEYSLNS